MTTGRSVRDQVLLLLLSMVLLVGVVAATGTVGVISLTDDVDMLVDELRPAAESNIALRNDMARAQAAALDWSLTRDPAFRARHEGSVTEVRIELNRLRRLVARDTAVAQAAAAQELTIEQWLSFAGGLVGRGDEPASRSYLMDGAVTYDRFAEHNDSVSRTLNASMDRRGKEARDRARVVIELVVLVSLLGLAGTALLGRTVIRRLAGPLQEMETAVGQLAAGELGVRVATDGPREIQGVATALNTLARENQRSREMEEQVVRQLTELDRAKDEFVSTVSHELRTPLTSIAGYVELFEEGFVGGLTPEQGAMLGVVRRNVDRLRLLIEDLLTLSRVEAEAFRTSFDVVDLSALTADVVHDVAEIAARSDVRVRSSTPGHQIQVNGDAGQLSRAVLNLVTNAIKFSPLGKQVLVKLQEHDGKAVVSVVDHGIGIPAEELATLGTRFFRASNAVEAEITGTGLGLRIVQTIADNHGGRLELESREGEGTTARLIVPLMTGE